MGLGKSGSCDSAPLAHDVGTPVREQKKTLSGCLLALKDVASVWRESETRLGSTSLSTWPRLQAAFLARFQEAKSAVEQVSIISNLKQQQKEVYETILTGSTIPSI